jgi:2-methylcitrate dehydratase PrpD
MIVANPAARAQPAPASPTASPTLTERLATALGAIRPGDLDPTTIADGKRFVLDWLAAALGGTATPAGQMLVAEGQSRGAGPCALLGVDSGRDAEVAALVNGGLSHIIEMDDLDRASVVHPGTVVIPAALAAAEETGANGLAFLTAVVVGYEAALRVGAAVGRSHYAYWQNTATCGVFGAAAAVGHLLHLTPEAMTWAFGNAGSVAGGLWQFNHDGAMTKHLHAGRAAANGLLAARLAARGFTGARAILEGPQGFFAAMSDDADPPLVVAGLDTLGSATPWKIAGVSIKPHASCRHTHPAVDAALALRAQLGDASSAAIARVHVETYGTALAITDAPAPRNPYQAKFSLQYTVAHALRYGRVGLHDFGPDRLTDPDLRALMSRVVLSVDPTLDAAYPQTWGARVTIELTDGPTHVATVDVPKGDPENPLTLPELAAKLQDVVAGTAYASQAERILALVEGLDTGPAMHGFLPWPDPSRLESGSQPA